MSDDREGYFCPPFEKRLLYCTTSRAGKKKNICLFVVNREIVSYYFVHQCLYTSVYREGLVWELFGCGSAMGQKAMELVLFNGWYFANTNTTAVCALKKLFFRAVRSTLCKRYASSNL